MLSWLRAAVSRLAFSRHRSLALVAEWLAGQLWLIETTYLALAQRGYSGNSVAYSCLRLLSQSVPEAPCRFYQEDPECEERALLPRTHPISVLMRHPNELMTEYEFWELTTLYLAIGGRAPWWKQRNNAGQPIALWPLRPDRVAPIYSDSDRPGERVIIGYSYLNPGTGTPVPIARRDVIAFNLPDPAGESGGIVEGLGPLKVLAAEISADNEATNFVGALLRNYAAPNLVITTATSVSSEEEAKLIKAKAKAEFGGARRGDVALLDADAKIQMLGFNLEQLEFPDLRAVAESRIAAAVGVPAVLVGLKVGLDRSTFANFSEARAFFAETTLSVYWRRYADQLGNDLAPEFGEGIVCEFDTSNVRALAGQRVEKLQPISDGFKAGVVIRNEYRVALGLDPDPNGNVYLVQATLAEVPMLDHVRSQPTTIQPSSPSPESPPPPPLPPGGGGDGGPGGKGLRLAADPDDLLDRAQAEDEKRLEIALQATFDNVLGDVVTAIAAGEAVSDAMLEAWFIQVLKAELVKTVRSQLLGVATQVGVQFDPAVTARLASEWAQQYSFELVKGLTETTQGVIADAVSSYMANPTMTMEELRALLEPAFGSVRAKLISQTETTRAWTAATEIYKQQVEAQYPGVAVKRTWYTQLDELVCRAICEPLNGKDESMWGDYSDGPPGHPNCRCRVLSTAVRKKVA